MESYNISNLNLRNENLLNLYFSLVRSNVKFLIIINVFIFSIACAYAYLSPDIYVASALIKIETPTSNVLKEPSLGSDRIVDFDRRISNEIETMSNPNILQKAANVVYDSLNSLRNLIKVNNNKTEVAIPNVSLADLLDKMSKNVAFEQKSGLDFVEIYGQSKSPLEAALIANAYADAYRDFNLLENQQHYTVLKKYLAEQCDEKRKELNDIENKLKIYKLNGGVIELNEQTKGLITELSNLETQKNAINIDLSRIRTNLDQYNNEIQKKDPSLKGFLESQSNEPYLKKLQDEIARIQTQKDLAASSFNKNSDIVKDYDNKLNDLKEKLKKGIEDYQSNILSASPEEIKSLTTKIFEEETNYKSLMASRDQLNSVLGGYEKKFNSIPEKSINLARMERDRMTIEKLYLDLENNYQAALINEKSTPGNVLIMNYASVPSMPAKPNRKFIVVLGLIIGHVLGLLILYVRTSLQKKVKSPDDILHNQANVISWIPRFNRRSYSANNGYHLVFINDPESLASEAFRTLRTRIQNIITENKVKAILITSTAPGEGKSTVSGNLSVSFAKLNVQTVLIDADLRAPSIQTLFNIKGSKGLSECLSENCSLDECIKKSIFPNLDLIVAGKIPADPSELLSSPKLGVLIDKLKSFYDLIIVDSPPIMAVTDAEVVLKYVDISILVVTTNKTEIDWMKESIEILKKGKSKFFGVVLNKFDSKSTYHSYYKYYNKDYKKIKR